MFQYRLFNETLNSSENGEYKTTGIMVLDENENELIKMSDVSTNEDDVKKVVDLCNQEQVEPIHLYDILEDFLWS